MSLLVLLLLIPLTSAFNVEYDYAPYDYCDPRLKLCEVASSHTMCRFPAPGLSWACTPEINEPLTEVDKKEILDMHNNLRRKVATGAEKTEYGTLPLASNMRQMYWDKELETIAERWAEQCINITDIKIHDECRNTKRFYVSQNVGTVGYQDPTSEKLAARMFYRWYMKSKFFRPNISESYMPTKEHNRKTEEFTNLIWADTYAIGCARVIFRDNIYDSQATNKNSTAWLFERVVCNYGPGGNIPGRSIYKRGAPCSECSDGLKCSKDFPGLCSIFPDANNDKRTTPVHETVENKTIATRIHHQDDKFQKGFVDEAAVKQKKNTSPKKTATGKGKKHRDRTTEFELDMTTTETKNTTMKMKDTTEKEEHLGNVEYIKNKDLILTDEVTTSKRTTEAEKTVKTPKITQITSTVNMVFETALPPLKAEPSVTTKRQLHRVIAKPGVFYYGVCHCPDINRNDKLKRDDSEYQNIVREGMEYLRKISAAGSVWSNNNGWGHSKKIMFGMMNGDRCFCTKQPRLTNDVTRITLSRFLHFVPVIQFFKFAIYYLQ